MEAKLGTRPDEGLIKMIHGLLATDGSLDSTPKAGRKEEQLFGVVQRECRDSQVSVKGLEKGHLRHEAQAVQCHVREAQVVFRSG